MLASKIIATRKESATSKWIVPTTGNVVDTTNRLDGLNSVTLTGLANNNNIYCTSATGYNKRTLILRTTTMWSDGAILTLPMRYTSATSKWSSRYFLNGGAYNTTSPAGTTAFITALNAGTETSLFGATNFTSAPTFETTSGSYYTWDATNLEFVSSGVTGPVICITLSIQLLFLTLPAGGYFTFRIRDVTNSTILMTQVIQNTGVAGDEYKMLKFSAVCSATTRYKVTVQYSGPAITRYSSATGGANGSRICFQELGGSNIT